MILLDNFNSVFDSKKFIPLLKQFILDLGIRGKLSNQKENETVFLDDTFKKVRDQLIAERKVKYRNSSDLEDIKNLIYTIPSNWKWFHLPEVVFFQEGPGIRNWQFKSQGIKLLNVQNILPNGDLHLEKSDKYVSEKEFNQKYKHFLIQEGDLLFASSGGSWGKSAWFKDPGYKVMLNTSTIRLKFYHPDFEPNYLKYFLDSSFFNNQMSLQLVGMQPNFGSTHLGHTFIPIPPIEEQKRIVKKIDSLIDLLNNLDVYYTKDEKIHNLFRDSLMHNMNNNFEKYFTLLLDKFNFVINDQEDIKEFKNYLLSLAVKGKLVPQDSSDEPASVLLNKIKAEKERLIKEKKIKKEKPLPAITEEEIPYELPNGWEWVRLGEVVRIIAGTTFKSYDFNTVKGVKVIKITNCGVKQFIETKDYLPDHFREKYPEVTIYQGDLVIALTRPYISAGLKICLCPASYDGSLLNQRVSAIKDIYGIDSDFLFNFLTSDIVLNKYKARFGNTGLQPNLKMKDISELEFPLPPLTEQARIVQKVDQLMKLCDELEEKVKENQKNSELLMEAVLREAFESA